MSVSSCTSPNYVKREISLDDEKEAQLNKKPLVVIFLDIDGVLYNEGCIRPVYKWITTDPSREKMEWGEADPIKEKMDELFPNRRKSDFPDYHHASSVAASHFFSDQALKNLDQLISQIEKIARVAVVISSSWREGKTVEELRGDFFKIHNFSKYIIDKTPDKVPKNEWRNYPTEGTEIDHASTCRKAQIQYWLKNHSEKVDAFIVLDDQDSHHLSHFGQSFFKTNFVKLLTSEIVDDAVQYLQSKLDASPRHCS